jgi:hypothetical protein
MTAQDKEQLNTHVKNIQEKCDWLAFKADGQRMEAIHKTMKEIFLEISTVVGLITKDELK